MLKILCIVSIAGVVCIFLIWVIGNEPDERRIAPVGKDVEEAISRSLDEELAGSISTAFSSPKGLRHDGNVWISANQYQSVHIYTPLQLHQLESVLEALDTIWSETRDESYADILIEAKIIGKNEKARDTRYLYRSNHGFDRQWLYWFK